MKKTSKAKNGKSPNGRSRKTAVVPNEQLQSTLFDYYTRQGLSPAQAGEAVEKSLQAPPSKYLLATNGESDILGTEVAMKTKEATNGHAPAKRRRDHWREPSTTNWFGRFAIGFATLLDERGLTMDEVSEKSGVDRTALYRIKHGQHPATTAVNADEVARFFGIDFLDVIKAGDKAAK